MVAEESQDSLRLILTCSLNSLASRRSTTRVNISGTKYLGSGLPGTLSSPGSSICRRPV